MILYPIHNHHNDPSVVNFVYKIQPKIVSMKRKLKVIQSAYLLVGGE